MKFSPRRPINFSAGPGTIPEEVLETIQEEIFGWHGIGVGVMEMSHRSKEFISIYQSAQEKFRHYLQIPKNFKILFMQGGGIAQNAIVPMNLARRGCIDFWVTGNWSQKSYEEAGRYANDIRVAASSKLTGYTEIPTISGWKLNPAADYIHICSNETVQGVQFQELPDISILGSQAPLVVDCSSDLGSRSVDWSRAGLVFAAAQKNLGIAGLTIVVVREDLIGRALPICPSAFDYSVVDANESMYNTPPTWAIYVAELVLGWAQTQREGELTGVRAIEVRNKRKAEKIYRAIDESSFYHNNVAHQFRSDMNVPFLLADSKLDAAFLSAAKENNLLQLKGHKSVGGMRASLYNAMTEEGVDSLVDFLKDFERTRG